MNKAAAAILRANFNIPRTGTGTISESDVSKLKRTGSEITSSKPVPPKVSPRNRGRKLTHSGVVQQQDIDSTPRSVKKLELVKEGVVNVTVLANQSASSVETPVDSKPCSSEEAMVTEHPVSPTSGQWFPC